MQSLGRSQGGQVLPVLLVMFVALIGTGAVLFQVGRASGLSADAQTAADAAALAGAKNMQSQLEAMAVRTGYSDVTLISDDLVWDAAQDYAVRNGANVVDLDRSGLEVTVKVSTAEELGEDARSIGSEDAQGLQTATAELSPSFALGGPGGGLVTSIGGGGNIPDREWDELREQLGDNPRDIVTLGRWLESQGIDVSEHPSFGGVCTNGCHVTNSWHYRNGALDVNVYPEEAEMPVLDRITPRIAQLGFHTLWRVEDHFDHLHVDIGAPGFGPVDAAGGGYGPAVFEIKLVESE